MLQSPRSHHELMSIYSDSDGFLQSETLHNALTHREVPTKGNIAARSTKAWGRKRTLGKREDRSRDYHGVQEPQVDSETTPEDKKGSITTALQEVIDDKVEPQAANALATILQHVEEAAEHLFWATPLDGQGETCTVVHESWEHITLDQIRVAVLGKNLNKPVDKELRAGKTGEPLRKRLLHNKEVLASRAPSVQMKTMDEISDQRRVDILISTIIAAGATGAAVASDANFEQEAPARRSSESSSEGSFKRSMSCQTYYHTFSPTCRQRSKK